MKNHDSDMGNKPQLYYHTVAHPASRLLQVNEASVEKNKDILAIT